MSTKKVVLMEFEANPNIGLYMFVNDKLCILGKNVDEKKKKEIEDVLGVKVYHATVLGTELAGVFVAGNNEIMLVPDMYEYELKEFEKIAEENSMKVIILKDKQNTLGNNLCVSETRIIANSAYTEKFLKDLAKKSNLDVVKLSNKDYPSSGAICRYANSKYFISQELTEDQVKEFITEIGGIGTVNSGGNYVSSGIVGNKKGLILGSGCSTIEIQNIVESLDYL